MTTQEAPAPLRDLARLLAPLGERSCELVVASADWSCAGSLPLTDVVLWGRLPSSSGPTAAAVVEAGRRERAIDDLLRRPPLGSSVRAVHRLEPAQLRTGPRARLRSLLRHGALVEVVRGGPRPRLVDRVVDEAGGCEPVTELRLGSGGALLARLRTADGPALLRAAPRGGAGDPATGARALRTLAGSPVVPALLGEGQTGGAVWTSEQLLPGRRPGRLTPRLVEDVTRFCAALPRPGAAASASAELDALAVLLPACAAPLGRLADRVDDRLAALPAVSRHGDLWSGNLLAAGGRLSGVLDWDAWSPAGVPGVDLLHLVGTQVRLARRQSLGRAVLDRPWEGSAFRSAAAGYWPSFGGIPGTEQQTAVGLAWWAGQVLAALLRDPALADQPQWRDDNVAAVLSAVESASWWRAGPG